MKSSLSKSGNWMILIFSLVLMLVTGVAAQEVKKGEIPAEHLAKSCKQLPWKVQVWDNEEALAALQGDQKILWVDTRPASFFQKGSVRGAVMLVFDTTGSADNTLTAESLEEALSKAGMVKGEAKIAFFCQGPECHRSYNAAFVAVQQWGYSPDAIIWYRDGYPNLFQDIKESVALKRKAKVFLSDEALSQL